MPKARATHTCNRDEAEERDEGAAVDVYLYRDCSHARYIGGERASMGKGGRIESRGEAICLPNEMSPRLYALRCSQ